MDLDKKLRPGIAGRLRRLCRAMELAHGLTQHEIGIRAGVHDAGTWSGHLSGRTKVPYAALIGLWKAFGADPMWVIDGETRNNTDAFNAALMAWDKGPQDAPPKRRGRPPKKRP